MLELAVLEQLYNSLSVELYCCCQKSSAYEVLQSNLDFLSSAVLSPINDECSFSKIY